MLVAKSLSWGSCHISPAPNGNEPEMAHSRHSLELLSRVLRDPSVLPHGMQRKCKALHEAKGAPVCPPALRLGWETLKG